MKSQQEIHWTKVLKWQRDIKRELAEINQKLEYFMEAIREQFGPFKP